MKNIAATDPETISPEILIITSYPPRECGIATYSQDLVKALQKTFHDSFLLQICPIESDNEQHIYDAHIGYTLNTDKTEAFSSLSASVNRQDNIQLVVIQHEFGLFRGNEQALIHFMHDLQKPVLLAFHTVLPQPDEVWKRNVTAMSDAAAAILVMTHSSARILQEDYDIPSGKIRVIPHGTHLVPHPNKNLLKKKYDFSGRKVLSTFGLLGSGKSIETTLDALPAIIQQHPDVLFLIIGKTHPSVLKQDGEQYRQLLEAKVQEHALERHVKFINAFLPLPVLLEHLQLTDIYLFTSKDPNQAVSGTFSYAISCGCPVISTPIPHAREVLQNEAGVCIDFGSSAQLAEAVNRLLHDEPLRDRISSNGRHKMASSAWENSALAHARLFEKISVQSIALHYTLPDFNLDHIKKLTTDFGIIQFSKINQPDPGSGYTLDDNARALIAMCQHFEESADVNDLEYIHIYFRFIKYCQKNDGSFLNYVDSDYRFSSQNHETNLEDANGRAIWALGYLFSVCSRFPDAYRFMGTDTQRILQKALRNAHTVRSPRAMAFTIKGLHYYHTKTPEAGNTDLVRELADRLVQMYRHEAGKNWYWFESYLTYANSILPEAMLCAWSVCAEPVYKKIAFSSFDFLLSKIFQSNRIKVIPNTRWLQKEPKAVQRSGNKSGNGGEQPIDVAYTILALSKFYDVYKDERYLQKMETAFNWFLGANHLDQIIYNPCTGGCYDGLEEHNVNLNQGAESSVSYLMARLTLEKSLRVSQKNNYKQLYYRQLTF